jgi:hypothetical protein
MWLRDSLPRDLKGARVILYGYDTVVPESKCFQRIDELATHLSESIRSVRRYREVCDQQVHPLSTIPNKAPSYRTMSIRHRGR